MIKVQVPYIVYVTVEIDTDDPEVAKDEAWERSQISSFAGNGGYDKIIGVYGSSSIEASEEPYTCDGFDLEILED